MKKLDRKQIAARLARDIPDGAYVNLGIGLPTLVADYLPKDREIVLHSENGVLGIGPRPATGAEDEDLTNAGKEPVTLLKGASFFHHADSFGMIRGRHLDYCVLGAFQVSAQGDLAKNVLVMMEHLTKEGKSKIVERCSYPLTGAHCVDRIYTDLAVIDVKTDGLHVAEIVGGLSFEELQRLTGVALKYREPVAQ
jgi:3-oxoadipate CoA-transferase beta subunit